MIKILAVACALVSLCLIAQLWLAHRSDSTFRKLFWSLLLLIPLVGWIFYGGFYSPPQADSAAGRAEDGSFGQW